MLELHQELGEFVEKLKQTEVYREYERQKEKIEKENKEKEVRVREHAL